MAYSSVSQPFVMYLAILMRFKLPEQRGQELRFTNSVVEASGMREITGWFYKFVIK